jgi:hypothetical protein
MYRARGLDPFDDQSALYGLLTDEPHVHWSTNELRVQLGWSEEQLADALAELERDGIVHRSGRFCWPTRAAIRSRVLLV